MAHNYLKHPTEDYMTKHTLWPEMNKLYGHPYELSAIAVGKGVLASSCHSLNNESAFIIVWDSMYLFFNAEIGRLLINFTNTRAP